MNWNTVLGTVCTVSFLLPVIVILYNRFYTYRSLIALLAYFVNAAVSNMMVRGLLPVSPGVRDNFGLLSNYLDVPLMLASLQFFCPNRQKQRLIRILIVSFIGFELAITLFHGFSRESITYIMGPGFILILLYSSYLFARQVKFSVMHRKNGGRMMMLASILFVYACYTLVYVFYYIQHTPYTSDVMAIYFIASFAASTLMAIGLHLTRKRMKELRSLRHTRRELEIFFNRP